MDPRPRATCSAFVGRASELAAVGALLERAAAGDAGALLISGDAGVGKSALVERACSHADPSAVVLAGSCLPLSAMTVPFLALKSAVRSVGAAFEPPAGLLEPGEAPSSVPVAFDQWLAQLCRDRPVILVIDDLHWADQSTLDVLMYLLAGPADRRLAVIGTVRRGEVGEGHPLQHWLADVRRLPRIEQVVLDPLDRATTSEHLAALLGSSPHQSLVEEVFAHTRGNAYLTRLLVEDLAPDARSLPADLPADLSSAVLQSWRMLPSLSRDLTQILAVGGGPLKAIDLAAVSGGALDPDDARASLLTAAEAGILDVARNGSLWFHHPMIAEALERTLTDDERVRWHGAFAERAEQQMVEDAESLELMIAASDHHGRAGHAAAAYGWALRAADSAESSGGSLAELRLLQSAVQLRARFPDTQEHSRDLLHRLVSVAAATGSLWDELQAIDLRLDDVCTAHEPLVRAELLIRRADLRLLTGADFDSEGDVRAAVDLAAAADGASWQHAIALAKLAEVAMWRDDPDLEALADRALAVARESGSARALSRALGAKSCAALADLRLGEAGELAEEAVSAAIRARDHLAFFDATMWEMNSQVSWSPRLDAMQVSRRRDQLSVLGAPHAYSAMLSAIEAELWLTIGEWRACQDRLRVTLGSDPGPFADVHARLAAAKLAAWQGRTAEAQSHLARADELVPDGTAYLFFTFDLTRAIVALAAGDAEGAVTAALAGAMSPGVPTEKCEWLMPLAARALADLIQGERDAGRDASDQLERLADLTTRFPSVIEEYDRHEGLHVLALNDLYEAEVGRARRLPDNGDQWIRATDSCHAASLAWEEAYACWRGAESLLAHSRQHRDEAATSLRRGLALAAELGAEPIRQELDALASSARISTERVTDVPATDLVEISGPTAREREILTHVVAGRTYREIARALVISEKTVSSHISNLLRKTRTDNRVDLARLATRSTPEHGLSDT